jgi:hypothetical protein
MYRIIIALLFISFFFSLETLADDIFFSGEYQDISFDRFILDVENKTGVHFFYRQEWISGITVTAKGDNLSLTGVLEKSLAGTGLYFYINNEKNIFITPVYVVTILNEYPGDELDNRDKSSLGDNGITDIRQKYFEGQKPMITETIIIGNKENNISHNKVIINGKIWNKENGESLIGATIYIEELKTGSATDVDGRFSLVLAPGEYNAMFNCMGMKEVSYLLEVYSDGQLNISMEKKIYPINEVVIQADRYQNVRGLQMGFEQLDIKTIKEIPLVLGEKDLLKVAQMLPGIQTVGEGSSGFNVRGSPADQNLFYINKVPVYNTSHLFGFFSSFNPDIVKDFSMFKSNIPVEYGGRLASFFDISTRQGNKKNYTARGGISPVTGHIAIEGPLKKEHNSFVVSARSTYSDWLLSELEDPDLRNSNASFYDISTNINIEPNENNLFKIFGYYASDRFDLANLNEYQYSNSGGSLTWKRRISSSISSDFAAIFGNYFFKTTNKECSFSAYEHEYNIGHYELKSDMHWVPEQKHTISFGGNLIYYDLNRGHVVPYQQESNRLPVHLGKENGIEGAIYFADKIRLSDWLTFYGGIRYSFFSFLGPGKVYEYNQEAPKNSMNIKDTITFSRGEIIKMYSGPELRTALNISTGINSSLKISYNRIRQYIFMLSNTIAISPTDQWKLCDYHINPPYCDQVSTGFYKDFPRSGFRTSIETYFKRTYNVVEYKDGADFISSPQIEEDVLQGNQTAYGIELMLKKKTGKLNGWVSYCYSKSDVLVNGIHTWDKINQGYSYPANYDKPHALNMIVNYKVNRRLSFSSNLVYNTGRPVTYPVSVYYINEQEILNYSLRNKYRLPDYFRIDLSINLEGNLKSRKKIHSYWMLNIYNLTGRKNAYSVYFRSEDGKINGYKMSIFGTRIVTISWNFKLGNYASE